MNVSLTPEIERRITERVDSGLYTTASEVVREGLRLLFERDEAKAHRLDRLRAEIQLGFDDIERGDVYPGEQTFQEAFARIRAKSAT